MRNPFIRRRFAPALVLLAVLAASGCDISVGNGDFNIDVVTGKAQDEWTRSYDLQPGGKVEIVNINGKIQVEATDGARLEVRAERIVKARTDEAAREALPKVEIVEEASPAGVRLQTKIRERLGMGRQQEVRYFLKVPRGAEVRVETTNGGVDVQGMRGAVVASTTNGGVVGRAIGGRVEASTTNGGVELELAAVDEGGVKIETVNGGVRLRVPQDAKADLTVRCVNGGIGVENLKLDETERSRRRLDARLNGGGPKIDVETTNGGIRIAGQ
jgi:hypothetical protein